MPALNYKPAGKWWSGDVPLVQIGKSVYASRPFMTGGTGTVTP